MSYYYSRTVDLTYETAIERVTEELKKEAFGVLTQVDIQATLKKKLDVDFRPYIILGACNPSFAYKALQAEHNLGLLLPCNVIVQAGEDGKTEVACIDPMVTIQSIQNPALNDVASEVRAKLRRVIESV